MNKSFGTSICLHIAVLSLFSGLVFLSPPPSKRVQDFEVIEKFTVSEKASPPPVNLDKPVEKPAPKAKPREVYGVSRKSILASESGTDAKLGNTLVKDVDQKKLSDDDADSIPIPADEFLITSMPRVVEEIRPVYPPNAKAKQLEGKVIFEIIVDEKGNVRQAVLLKSIDPEMDKSAEEAIKKFRFKPAMIESQAVAAKIKYAINFVLE